MRITEERHIDTYDVLRQLEAMRLPKYTSLNLNFEGKKFEFTADEWNRVLDLAAKGYEAEKKERPWGAGSVTSP